MGLTRNRTRVPESRGMLFTHYTTSLRYESCHNFTLINFIESEIFLVSSYLATFEEIWLFSPTSLKNDLLVHFATECRERNISTPQSVLRPGFEF